MEDGEFLILREAILSLSTINYINQESRSIKI